MGQNKFLKIFSLVMFVAFAAVSCWSTTESLFLTLENAQIPKWVFWIAVVGLFVLTSICSKMVVDSLNPNSYVENKRLKFVLGILGMLVLWLAFSMPTNSHTFFYKQMAKNTAEKELKHIDVELTQLSSVNAYLESYQNEWDSYEANVNMWLGQLKEEINDPDKLGFGDIAESKLAKIEDLLGVKTKTIARRGTHRNSQAERNQVCEYYDKVVKDQLQIKLNQHQAKVNAAIEDFQERTKNVEPIRRNIENTLEELNDPQYEREGVLKKTRQIIAQGYAELESTFNGLYHKDENIYRSDRLVKVTKVWGDYFTGRFKNTDYTLWYWILLSIIVDLAAFCFFDIAFKKEY